MHDFGKAVVNVTIAELVLVVTDPALKIISFVMNKAHLVAGCRISKR